METQSPLSQLESESNTTITVIKDDDLEKQIREHNKTKSDESIHSVALEIKKKDKEIESMMVAQKVELFDDMNCKCCDCCTAECFYGITWNVFSFGCCFYVTWVIISFILNLFSCCNCCKKMRKLWYYIAKKHKDPFIMEIKTENCGGQGGCLCNAIWFPFGIICCLFHIILGIIYFPFHLCTFPFGIAHLQLAYVSLRPNGLTIKEHKLTCYEAVYGCGGIRDVYRGEIGKIDQTVAKEIKEENE